MILSRKSNSSWHSFLTTRFGWNWGCKKVFPGTPALPVWMPRSHLGGAWNTSLCPGGLWAETLDSRGAVQLGSDNLRERADLHVVVFRSWSILGHENGGGWFVNWCQCCACSLWWKLSLIKTLACTAFIRPRSANSAQNTSRTAGADDFISNGKRNRLYGLTVASKIPFFYWEVYIWEAHFHLEDSEIVEAYLGVSMCISNSANIFCARHSCEEKIHSSNCRKIQSVRLSK